MKYDFIRSHKLGFVSLLVLVSQLANAGVAAMDRDENEKRTTANSSASSTTAFNLDSEEESSSKRIAAMIKEYKELFLTPVDILMQEGKTKEAKTYVKDWLEKNESYKLCKVYKSLFALEDTAQFQPYHYRVLSTNLKEFFDQFDNKIKDLNHARMTCFSDILCIDDKEEINQRERSK